MHIITKRGWQPLHVAQLEKATEHVAHNGMPAPYRGQFPSQALCDFVNGMQEKIKYFDNGVRLMYGKADRIVATDNATPEHPIAQMPEGF